MSNEDLNFVFNEEVDKEVNEPVKADWKYIKISDFLKIIDFPGANKFIGDADDIIVQILGNHKLQQLCDCHGYEFIADAKKIMGPPHLDNNPVSLDNISSGQEIVEEPVIADQVEDDMLERLLNDDVPGNELVDEVMPMDQLQVYSRPIKFWSELPLKRKYFVSYHKIIVRTICYIRDNVDNLFYKDKCLQFLFGLESALFILGSRFQSDNADNFYYESTYIFKNQVAHSRFYFELKYFVDDCPVWFVFKDEGESMPLPSTEEIYGQIASQLNPDTEQYQLKLMNQALNNGMIFTDETLYFKNQMDKKVLQSPKILIHVTFRGLKLKTIPKGWTEIIQGCHITDSDCSWAEHKIHTHALFLVPAKYQHGWRLAADLRSIKPHVFSKFISEYKQSKRCQQCSLRSQDKDVRGNKCTKCCIGSNVMVKYDLDAIAYAFRYVIKRVNEGKHQMHKLLAKKPAEQEKLFRKIGYPDRCRFHTVHNNKSRKTLKF